MPKILILGYPPPQLVRDRRVDAANYRTWQFLKPLVDEGHHICLCEDSPINNGERLIPREWQENVVIKAVPYNHLGWKRKLQIAHDSFNPDCIVAINFDMCLYATSLRTNKPIWMDIYGDELTIIQAACFRAQSDRGIPTSIAFVHDLLRKGDIFSVCSTLQEHALVGELAMAGRLNYRTFGYQFTKLILPGAFPNMENSIIQNNGQLFTLEGIDKEDFVVLWCGGYNTWTDVDTLFNGLEWAMSNNQKIKFLSIGENTYNAPDNVYSCFLSKINQSRFADHFYMMGWRPWLEIPNYYRISNLGLNIDALNYETIYGTRTRILEMIAASLPVITTRGTELSNFLRERRAIRTFEIGDWRGLGNSILWFAENPDQCKKMGELALKCASDELSFAVTTLPLQIWVRDPKHAPDKCNTSLSWKMKNIEFQTRAIARRIIWKLIGFSH